MLPVAVIDDGINEKLFGLPSPEMNIEIREDLSVSKRPGDNLPGSHGTLCAAVIHELAPDAGFASIKITNDDTRKSSTGQLCTALRLCARNKMRLVNLSMGTVDRRDFPEVETAVEEVCGAGGIIVAAFSNLNIYTCPASLENVFGVKCADGKGSCRDSYFYYDTRRNNILAYPDFSLTDRSGHVHVLQRANSFAAPIITAAVYNLLKKNPGCGFSFIRDLLIHNEKNEKLSEYRRHGNTDIPGIRTPAVLIYGKDGGRRNRLSMKIAGMFAGDGYGPAVVYTGKIEEKAGVCTVPAGLCLCEWENRVSCDTVFIAEHIYKPDILVFSVDREDITEKAAGLFDIVAETDTGAIRDGGCVYFDEAAGMQAAGEKDEIYGTAEGLYSRILDEFDHE